MGAEKIVAENIVLLISQQSQVPKKVSEEKYKSLSIRNAHGMQNGHRVDRLALNEQTER